jgi:hypothetical protein
MHAQLNFYMTGFDVFYRAVFVAPVPGTGEVLSLGSGILARKTRERGVTFA